MKQHMQKCPTCGKSIITSLYNKWLLFCCEKCRLIDLGEWLDGTKRMITKINPEYYLSNDDNLIH